MCSSHRINDEIARLVIQVVAPALAALWNSGLHEYIRGSNLLAF